ncbi:MAG: 1-acyl-sn-glycerol-3-phosphate acyltransferase [Alkalilacustris sp.]
MLATVELPIWLFVLIVAFAAVTFASHFLFPSVRWFFRRRMERAVAELNKRLERPIQPFKLMRRQDMIVRLIYDPQVMEAVVEHAQAEGVPESVAFQTARRYAREIVPSFSAATYFGPALRLARGLSRGLYEVRLGHHDEAVLRGIDRKAAVVFVMNHRSNMDYVLVTYLAADRSALSYAVGEWARVWPLQSLIRAMGAYFIRRRYRSPLYRRVLARYVQMATHEGVTQAIFPEGGLSLDGRVGPAKKGLLHYIVSDFDPADGRDVVFIPVALNYDRVLEDRVLLEAAASGERRFRARLTEAAGFLGRIIWQRLRGRFRRFGYAGVSFGEPLSLEAFLRDHPGARTDALAAALMGRIRAAVPVLPVPLVAAALHRAGDALPTDAVTAQAEAWVTEFLRAGCQVHLPDGSVEAAVREGLQALAIRRIVGEGAGGWRVVPGEEAALAFYAASIAHLVDAVAALPSAETPSPAEMRRAPEV